MRSAPRLGSAELVALCVLFTIALRIPFLTRPLMPDEAGLLIIAQNWSEGRFLYGDYFVGRGVLLVLFFVLAEALGGALGVRLLGCLVAAGMVLAAGWAGHQLRGRSGAGWAALVAASYSSTYALSSEGMNGRLLAAALVMAGCATTLAAIRHRSVSLAVLAGVLVTVPLLVVQSYADGLVFAGVTLLGLCASRRLPLAAGARVALGGLAGMLLTAGAVALAVATTWVTASQLWFQLVGARLAAAEVVGDSTDMPRERMLMMAVVAALTGVYLLLGALLTGLRRTARQPDLLPVWVAVAAMLALVGVSMVAGGDWWPDYLLQAIPALALGAALVAPSRTFSGVVMRVGAGVAAVASVAAIYMALERPELGTPTNEAAVGRWVAVGAEPQDTGLVLWGKANVLHHAGMTTPYPYMWSLLTRTLDPELEEMLATLHGPEAPTWVVRWHDPDAWGLDDSGRLSEVLDERYVEVGRPCGAEVYLLRSERRDVPATEDCGRVG